MKISNTLFAGVLTLLAVSVASIGAEIGTKLVTQNDLKPVRTLNSRKGYHPSPSNDDWRKPSKPTCSGGPTKKGCNSSPSKGYHPSPSNDDWSPSGPSKGDDEWSDDDWSPSGPSKRKRKCVCKTDRTNDDWKKTDDKCEGGPATKGCNTATSRTGKGKYTRALKKGSKYVIDSYRPRRHCTCTPVDDDDWGRKGKGKKGKKGSKGKKGKGKKGKGKKGKGKGKGRDDDWNDDDWSPSGPSKGGRPSKGGKGSDDDWSDDHTDDWSDDDEGDDWQPTPPTRCEGGPATKGCNSPSKGGHPSKGSPTDDDWSDDWSHDDEGDDWQPTPPTRCEGGPATKGCNSPSKNRGKKSKTTRRRRAI